MESRKLQIAHNQIPKVLFIGNGINRAYGYASWDDLIGSIRVKNLEGEEKECLKNVPYPLQPVILTADHMDEQMKRMSSQLSELCAPSDEEKILKSFAQLPVDGILTANYTYELEKSLSKQFKCMPSRRCQERRIVYNKAGQYDEKQLHTCFWIDDYPPIWHVHGEASRHGTMVLGHYFYGKLLSKMQQYVSKLLARYEARRIKKQEMPLYSWIDYFLLGDVYIVGLGMALSELDLWWLINCKKRHFPDRKVILYKPDIKVEEKLLAETYGVSVERDGFNGDYKEYYKWVYENIREKMICQVQ